MLFRMNVVFWNYKAVYRRRKIPLSVLHSHWWKKRCRLFTVLNLYTNVKSTHFAFDSEQTGCGTVVALCAMPYAWQYMHDLVVHSQRQLWNVEKTRIFFSRQTLFLINLTSAEIHVLLFIPSSQVRYDFCVNSHVFAMHAIRETSACSTDTNQWFLRILFFRLKRSGRSSTTFPFIYFCIKDHRFIVWSLVMFGSTAEEILSFIIDCLRH